MEFVMECPNGSVLLGTLHSTLEYIQMVIKANLDRMRIFQGLVQVGILVEPILGLFSNERTILVKKAFFPVT